MTSQGDYSNPWWMQSSYGHGENINDRLAGLSLTGAAAPRLLPPVGGNISWDDIVDGSDVDSSEYTATTRTGPPSIASSYTSSRPSSYAPSVFSKAPTPSSAGLTSKPARQPDRPNFVQALVAPVAQADYGPIQHNPHHQHHQHHHPAPAPAPAPVPAASTNVLWCELLGLTDCHRTFRLDQTAEWIAHHAAHLKDRYPGRLVCWFCNDHEHAPFDAAHRSERYDNFVERMEHIRTHIMDSWYTHDDMRPDFRMINHLRDQGVIGEEMWRRARGYNELPEALRVPGTGSTVGAGSFVPYQAQQPQSRSNLAHDLARESRHRRPRGGNRPARASGSHRP